MESWSIGVMCGGRNGSEGVFNRETCEQWTLMMDKMTTAKGWLNLDRHGEAFSIARGECCLNE